MDTADLATLRADYNASLLDTCTINAHTTSEDGNGRLQHTYTPGAAISCGYQPILRALARVEHSPDLTTARAMALLYLPANTAIDTDDRVTITHRNGVSISPTLTYQLATPPVEGLTGTIVTIEQLEP